jgi:hypothetical protein
MTDQIQSIREDLAFMKAMASDDGRLPAAVGAQFLAAAVTYGLATIVAWAGMRGLVALPPSVIYGSSFYATAVWLPIHIYLMWRSRGYRPTSQGIRAFGAVWSSVGLTTITILAVIFTASVRLHVPQIWSMWPAVCFALYGAAWWSVGFVRRSWSLWLVGLGSYATAVANGFLIGTPEVVLVCGLGLIVWLGGPGVAMMLRAKAPA